LKFFISVSLLLSTSQLFGQIYNLKVTRDLSDSSVIHMLNDVEEENIRFFYLPEWFDNVKLERSYSDENLSNVLNDVLRGSDISYKSLFGYDIIFYKHPEKEIQRQHVLEAAQENNIPIIERTLGDKGRWPSKKILHVAISTRDQSNNPVGNVYVKVSGGDIVQVTNESGVASFALPPGEYALNIESVNFEHILLKAGLYAEGTIQVVLEEMPVKLQEIEVTDQMITQKRISQTSIRMTDVKRAPSFLGMGDIIKQIQNLTGVSTVSEASSGFNVRGGSADQNLVLFDGVPIFNTSHALGFFTAFNTEAINRASFYKGAIPAEFGGRVSSVLDITSKEGDWKKWHGVGGIGMVASDLTLGGPITKDSTTVLLSVRSSYSDWLLRVLKTRYADIQSGSVFFYDGTFKVAHRLSQKGKLTLSGYTSSDQFQLANDTLNQWSNKTLSLRYDRTLNDNLFYTAGLSLGSYSYRISQDDPRVGFKLHYGMVYPSLKIDFNHEGNLHKRTFGFHSTYYSFNPGKVVPTSSQSNIAKRSMDREKAIESAFYFSDGFHWNQKLNIELGLRISIYNRVGAATIYEYVKGEPIERGNTSDSVHYRAGELIKTYVGPEPRLSFQYTLTPQSSLKLGANRIYQYVHLISNTAAITPTDIWQLSNSYFRPQRSDQVSFGYFRSFRDNRFEGFVEGYFKTLDNVLDFKDGATLVMNRQIETTLIGGTGKSYGVEFSINKNKGKLTGGMNYTWSRSLRRFSGSNENDRINRGRWYASNFDQPNNLNMNWRFALSKRVFFSGLFVYHTGRPISLPTVAYVVDGVPVTDFSERNNDRAADYHRLDLAFVIEGSARKKKLWESHWVISIYNVYGRKNPYSVFFADVGGQTLMPFQLALIGTPVPAVTYSFKF
jgi:hypothetical protein